MKKSIFTIVVSVALSLGALRSSGQGNVAFANQTTTAITNMGGQKLVAPAGTYMFGLYVGPAGSQASALTLVGTGVNGNWPANSGLDGFFSIGNPFTLASNPPGTAIAFQVRGWPADLGTSYEAALVNFHGGNPAFGESILGSVTPTAPPTPAAPLFGNTGGGLVPAFALGVPEPSSVVLGGLGLAAWSLIRRRKQDLENASRDR